MIEENIRNVKTPNSFYFKGSDVRIWKYLSKDEILAKVSEEEIFRKYCSNFKELGRAFCSELREDRNPSVSISSNRFGSLVYYDFKTKQSFNCFSYIMQKYRLDFKDCLRLITDDLGLNDVYPYQKPKSPLKRLKIALKPVFRDYNITDYNYWSKYGIKLTTLVKFNVYPCKQVNFTKDSSNYVWYESLNKPIYAYKFIKDGEIEYKIYRPYSEKNEIRFYSPNRSVIQGWDQLPKTGDLLILSKALKDVMTLYELGYNAIALQSESSSIKESVVEELQNRFKSIILLYDNDEAGVMNSAKLSELYNMKRIFIPIESKTKDISDYIKEFGFLKGEILIKNLLKNE